ncbi:unnamed protein product [Allacma fusca]|uniref:Tubulin glycylase 3A n=1 Tax=Allacma fusca TaxID=39272 RepID=A0A8J2JE98_9HEXA|nr:unnamed protein product [Allacma fusca]
MSKAKETESNPSFSSLPKTSSPDLSPNPSKQKESNAQSDGNHSKTGTMSRTKTGKKRNTSAISDNIKTKLSNVNAKATRSSSNQKKTQSRAALKIKLKPNPILSGKSVSQRSFRPVKKLTWEESRDFRAQIEQAIRGNQIFSLDTTPAYAQIRRSLVQRGWVEKNSALASLHASSDSFEPLSGRSTQTSLTDSFTRDTKQAWINRVLSSHPPDFIWGLGRHRLNFLDLTPYQLVNQFPHSSMTTKVGITAFLQNSHWVSEAGTVNAYFPRCYRLSLNEERRAFISDFYLTACIALLQWIVGAFERYGNNGIVSPEGKVDIKWVDFCVQQIENYIKVRKHEDIDWNSTPYVIVPGNWSTFLEQHHNISSEGGKLRAGDTNPQELYEMAREVLQSVAPFWPQLNIDGVNNLWICKPGASSRGNGIYVSNKLSGILKLLVPPLESTTNEINSKKNMNWVVQKYIERPLLIYKTKFDIRQWFIVQDWNPMSVWFYRECYLRFSSQIFTLDDLHRSIHLCNNVVQRKFKNTDFRDPALPEENMWDNYTFQAYLKTLGKEHVWHDIIYPGMKRAILGVLLAGQDSFEFRRNCFELYGADFLVTEDFLPWLIEINGSPTMAASTSVTARLRNQVLEDCVKVVIDHRQNPKAPTGMFELIYKQNYNFKHSSQKIGNTAIGVRKLPAEGYQMKANVPSKVNEPKSLQGIVFSGEIPDALSFPEDQQRSKMSFKNRLVPDHLIKRFQLSDPKMQPPLILPSKLNINKFAENREVTEEFDSSSPFRTLVLRKPVETKEEKLSTMNPTDIPNIPPVEIWHSEKNHKSIKKGPTEEKVLTYDCKDSDSGSGSSNNNSATPSLTVVQNSWSNYMKKSPKINYHGVNSPLSKTLKIVGGQKATNEVSAQSRVRLVPVNDGTPLSSDSRKKILVATKRPSRSSRPSLKTKESFTAKSSQKLYVKRKESEMKSQRKHYYDSRSPIRLESKIATGKIRTQINPGDIFIREMNLTAKYLKRNYPPENVPGQSNNFWSSIYQTTAVKRSSSMFPIGVQKRNSPFGQSSKNEVPGQTVVVQLPGGDKKSKRAVKGKPSIIGKDDEKWLKSENSTPTAKKTPKPGTVPETINSAVKDKNGGKVSRHTLR